MGVRVTGGHTPTDQKVETKFSLRSRERRVRQMLALQFARKVEPDPDISELMIYDPELQMNVFKKDGSLVIDDRKTLIKFATTTSTAGSKTHFDD